LGGFLIKIVIFRNYLYYKELAKRNLKAKEQPENGKMTLLVRKVVYVIQKGAISKKQRKTGSKCPIKR
jgi:hypothetical protein